jgi:serine/threonine-protein kinase
MSVCLQALTMLHHKCCTVHNDLKPTNVLVDEDGTVTLVDFDCCVHTALQGEQFGFQQGTLDFAAPEVLKGGKLTTAADIWSVGMILVELV